MLQTVLNSVGIQPDTCAGLLGVDPKLFAEWAAGQRPIPESFTRTLATMLGVPADSLRREPKGARSDADVTPAIWFKLRDKRLRSSDREYVALVRHLAFLVDQFEQATQTPSIMWESVFQTVREKTDREAPPGVQGREAAKIFRAARGLTTGATGIGTVIRGNLRAIGILVVETPLHNSALEGCSFYVSSSAGKRRPCIFANTHSSTWFRRNSILLHETAHLIFDAPDSGASLDFKNETTPSHDVSEERAQAFSQEVSIPFEVLRHISQKHGVKWDALQPLDMAHMIADTQAEQRMIVEAALDAGFLRFEDADRARALDVSTDLPDLTERALDAIKYFHRYPDAKGWLNKRIATATSLPLRLPVGYVKSVVDAVANSTIAWTKGAELLMVDRPTFLERFGEFVPSDE